MKVGKLDVVYLIALGVFLTTWNFGGNARVYYQLQAKLRTQEELLPGTLINPLAKFSAVNTPSQVPKNSDDGNDEDKDSAEESGDEEMPEENEDGGPQEGSSPGPEESESFLEDKRKALEEARKMFLEDTILTLKLDESMTNLEKGLLPAETRLAFDVDADPSDIISLETMDIEEREFAKKLQHKIGEWESALEAIDRAVLGRPLDSDHPSWAQNVEDQKHWEEVELSRLRDLIRQEEKATLSGRLVKDQDYYDVESSSNTASAQDYDEYAETEQTIAATPKNKSSVAHAKESGGAVAVQTKKKLVKPTEVSITLEGSISDFQDLVRSTEEAISYWTHTSEKSILVFGSPAYVHRDIDTYQRAFSKAGFSMEKRKKEGPLSSKVIATNEHPVLICLALKNDDCFSSAGVTKMQRYQRVNRITGLRAVLWSKDSFCKTISSGTKGEEMFSDYTFHCWIFPNEWTSAREYAQNHPEASYIVKPLTMGGGKGITVVDGEKGLKAIRFKTHLVQNYLPNPHLINNHKWDIRSYVLVTSTVPMRAYVFYRGLVRFASSAYDPNAKHGGKRSQFLTNTSVNKKYVKQNVTDITWAFSDLKAHLEKQTPGSYDQLFKRLQSAISIVFLSAEQEWRRYYSNRGESCHVCFQIMGVDLIVDSNMNPRVIEVNGQPNMKQSKDKTDHYSITKQTMMEDMVHMLFNEESVASELLRSLQDVDGNVLSTLTEQDWEYLIEYMKERKHRGGWKKVYPNAADDKLHSAFLEQQKPNPARLALHDVLIHLEQATKGMTKS